VGLESPHSFTSYNWGHPPGTTSRRGNKGAGRLIRYPAKYREPPHHQYNHVYNEHSPYESFQTNRRYDLTGYVSEAQQRWDSGPTPESYPPWEVPQPEEDVQNTITFKTPNTHGRQGVQCRKKPVPLNRHGVPDIEVDQAVYKNLHQDLMKFSAKLNPIYRWKAQPEDSQKRLRDRMDDAYEFEGHVSLNEAWLSSEISDGIGRNKFKLWTFIRGGQAKPPEVKQSYWDALVDLESAPETLEQSARMRSITHGRPPKGYSPKTMEKSVIAALVSEIH
jgi:hypothetical protein